ncbi:MAG: hypothetical protein ACI3ZK_02500, partial [Candidatus Cryptobacteroides sp.]
GEPISSAVEFLKVTSLADLGGEQDVIIVGKKDASYFAMGSQGSNNRPAVEITSVVNEAGDEVALDNTSTAHIFTLTKTESGYVFYDKDATSGYLYAAGTNASGTNYLRSTTTLDDSCYWDIVYDETGKATIKSVNNDKTPYMQYNATNTLFSCYAAESQSEVILFVDVMSLIPSLKKPSGLDAISEGNTVTIAWDSVENAESYIVTCGERTETTTDTIIEFTDLADGLYDVTVVATTSNSGYKDSAPAVTNVRVGSVSKSKVYFSINGVLSEGTELEEGVNITFPSDPSVEDVSFAGWTTSSISGTQDNAPVFVNTKSEVMGSVDVTYYAVFASESLTQTLAYDTWTYSGSTTDKSSYRMFHTDSYIESESFDLGILSKVVVYGGTFGGSSYNSLTISDGTNIWKNVTVSGSSQTAVNTYTDGNPLTGTGKLRITSNSGTASSTGVRISKVEIYVMSAYCTNVVVATGISVSGTPTKTEYEDGNVFDPSGLIVTKSFSDGSSEVVTSGINWSFDPAVLSEGTTSVSVTATVGDLVSAPYSVTGLIVNASTNTEVEFNYASLYSTVTGSSFQEVTSDTVDEVSMTYTKVSGTNAPKYYANGTNLRIYNESTITVEVPSGKILKEIDFSQGTTNWVSGKMSADSGTVDDENKKWTSNSSVSKVVLTITGSFRFTKIVVTYE